MGLLPMFLCSSSHLELSTSKGTGMRLSLAQAGSARLLHPFGLGLLTLLLQTSLESRVRAGGRLSAPFPGLQGLLFIFLEGNCSAWISEAP